jgi:predicted transcriptional regulator
MDIPPGSVYPRTAGDVMDRNLVVVPRQMLVREVARLIQRSRATEAAVVDEQGRFVGMLTPADLFRWVEAGCPEAVVGPALTCPYQVRGRLLTGGEAVICILEHGS